MAALAAAPFDVEAEITCRVVAGLRLDRPRDDGANIVERLHIGDRIGARRTTDRALVDENDVVELAVAEDVVERRGTRRFEFHPSAQRRIERVFDERAFAGTADAGDDAERAERELDRDVLQIVAARAGEANPTVLGLAAHRRHGRAASAREEVAGQAVRRFFDLGGRPLEDDFAAVASRAGSDFNELIGCADHRFVVLDGDDRVAAIAEPFDRLDEPFCVLRMQAGRRLVEHVQHVHQRRPEGRRERDSLHFAAAQRADRPIEREIVEADLFEITEPRRDLFEHHPADGPFVISERQRPKELDGDGDLHRRDLGQVATADQPRE